MAISSTSDFFFKRVASETLEEHDERLLQVLKRLESAGITLNENKSVSAQRSLTFLGHLIDENGVCPCPKKRRAIVEMVMPRNVSDIRRFLGMVNQFAKQCREKQTFA